MDRLTEETMTKLAQALHAAFQPNRAEVVRLLRDVAAFNPGDVPLQFTDGRVNPMYTPVEFKRKDVQDEMKDDMKAPFMSESYLYNLLGKEDARTLLARWSRLCRALGVDDDRLLDAEVEQAARQGRP